MLYIYLYIYMYKVQGFGFRLSCPYYGGPQSELPTPKCGNTSLHFLYELQSVLGTVLSYDERDPYVHPSWSLHTPNIDSCSYEGFFRGRLKGLVKGDTGTVDYSSYTSPQGPLIS